MSATAAAATMQRIPIGAIVPSPLNPRKSFDGIEELADSIKAQGLLENILVRPTQGDRFEIIAGERRWRACKSLKLDAIDCKVIKADDAQARAAQIVENLQREDVPPVEEADGFAKLQDEDPAKWSAGAIAKVVGKTPRFVQQRIAIARNLAPDLKKKLADGKLKIETARTLATVPQSLQLEVQDSYAARQGDAKQLQQELRSHAIPLAHAGFDVKAYKGEFIEDGGKRWFADIAEFQKLQNAAAQALVDKMRAGLWKKAKLVKEDDADDYCWADTLERIRSWETKTTAGPKSKVGVEHLTAIVWIEEHSHKLRQASRVVPAAVADKAGGAARRSGSSGSSGSSGGYGQRESAATRRSRLDFNDRLHVALTDKVDVGLRALLVEYLGGRGYFHQLSDETRDALHDSLLSPALAKLVKSDAYSDAHDAKVWAEVRKLPIAKVHKALAAYGSRAHYRWDSHDGGKPKSFEKAIAATLALEPREVLTAAQLAKAAKEAAAVKAGQKTVDKGVAQIKRAANAKAKAKGKKKQ